MAFFIKFTEGAHPGKKLSMPKRSAVETDDARWRREQKRMTTSWMKDSPWLFHDKETDKLSFLWCKQNDVTDCAFMKSLKITKG